MDVGDEKCFGGGPLFLKRRGGGAPGGMKHKEEKERIQRRSGDPSRPLCVCRGIKGGNRYIAGQPSSNWITATKRPPAAPERALSRSEFEIRPAPICLKRWIDCPAGDHRHTPCPRCPPSARQKKCISMTNKTGRARTRSPAAFLGASRSRAGRQFEPEPFEGDGRLFDCFPRRGGRSSWKSLSTREFLIELGNCVMGQHGWPPPVLHPHPDALTPPRLEFVALLSTRAPSLSNDFHSLKRVNKARQEKKKGGPLDDDVFFFFLLHNERESRPVFSARLVSLFFRAYNPIPGIDRYTGGRSDGLYYTSHTK